MTSPTPNGQIITTADGLDLVVTRTLPGSLADAWASITEPDRTARWMGRWEGEAGPGKTVRMQLGFEDDSPWADVKIIACEAPHRLHVEMLGADSPWGLAFELSAAGDNTALRFTQYKINPAEVSGVAPGWEWYLDQLVATMAGAELPNFSDYVPAQSAYYTAQLG